MGDTESKQETRYDVQEPPTVQEGVIFVVCELEAGTRSGVFEFYDVVTRKLGIKDLTYMGLHNSVRDAVEYLSRKTAKYCVIIVDLKNIEKDLAQHCYLYMKLLRKAKENIGEKVVVVVCGDPDHNINDLYSEDVKQQFSEYVTKDLEDKVTLMTWNTSHGKIHEDYMLQILHPIARQNQGGCFPGSGVTRCTDASTAPTNRQPKKGRPLPTLDSSSRSHSGKGGQGMTRTLLCDDPLGTNRVEDEWNIVTNDGNGNLQDNSRPKHDAQDPGYHQQDQRGQAAQHSTYPGYGHHGRQGTDPQYPTGTLLKTRLRKGKISYDREDVVYRHPGFMAPTWLEKHLRETKRDVNVATVEISIDQAGVLHPRIIEDSVIVGALKSSLFNIQ